MKKDKRKKSEARRRGSILQHGRSESASQKQPGSGSDSQQQPSSRSMSQQQPCPGSDSQQQPCSGSVSQQPSSGFSSQQQPDSEFTSQKQSGSRPGLTPQQLVSQAFQAPEISQSARGRQCHNTNTKPSSGPKKTGGQTSSLTVPAFPLLVSQGYPRSWLLSGSDARLTCVLELCLWNARGLGFVFTQETRIPGFCHSSPR